MNIESLSSNGKQLFEKIEFDSDEKLIYEVRKHSFGLLVIYLTGFFIATALFVGLVFGSLFINSDPLEMGTDAASIRLLMIVVGSILSLLAIVMTLIAGYLFQSNVVIVTSDKLAQFLYTTIFDRKISQLSIGDVQDVTVSQKGIFARLFNYGTLVVETAGEQQNYTFTYTPYPYEASKAIVGAHEENLKRYGN